MSVTVVVTDRAGGRSAGDYATLNLGTHVGDDPATVAANRCEVAARLGVAVDRLVCLAALPGGPVVAVGAGSPTEVSSAEALVTTDADLALLVLTADCVPVLLADDQAGVVAAAHAGRRGVEARIVGATVAAMAVMGGDPARTTAWLGPAICGRCYEVGDDVAAATVAVAPTAASTTSWGTTALDLPRAVADELSAAGVVEVRRSARCTYEDPALFSYRRDGRTGRQGSVIVRRAPSGEHG